MRTKTESTTIHASSSIPGQAQYKIYVNIHDMKLTVTRSPQKQQEQVLVQYTVITIKQRVSPFYHKSLIIV